MARRDGDLVIMGSRRSWGKWWQLGAGFICRSTAKDYKASFLDRGGRGMSRSSGTFLQLYQLLLSPGRASIMSFSEEFRLVMITYRDGGSGMLLQNNGSCTLDEQSVPSWEPLMD